MKKTYDNQTLWSKLLNHSFVFSPSKRISSSVELTQKFIENTARVRARKKIGDKSFDMVKYDDYDIYIYNNISDELDKKILIYVHGGNFVESANKYQMEFAKKIAKMTNSILVVPMYELLPMGNALKLQEFLSDLYIRILSYNPKEINLLGDSAGGGAVLSLSMLLRDKNLRVPDNVVMLSPWLDLSMSNEKLLEDEQLDYMNGLEGTRYEGKLWAGELDTKDPRVSPMYGSFNNLGNITVLYGGREILTSECERFTSLLEEQNIEYNSLFYKYEGHDFAIFPTKEGRKAINEIVNILGGNNNGGHTREINKG